MKSQLDRTTGTKGHIFSTDLHLLGCFSHTSHRGPRTKLLSLKLYFLEFSFLFNDSSHAFCKRTFEGKFFLKFLLGSWRTCSLVGKFVCLKPNCVFLDKVVCCRKRGCLQPNVGSLHQENIKRLFMRCCKEKRVF